MTAVMSIVKAKIRSVKSICDFMTIELSSVCVERACL